VAGVAAATPPAAPFLRAPPPFRDSFPLRAAAPRRGATDQHQGSLRAPWQRLRRQHSAARLDDQLHPRPSPFARISLA